MGKIRVLRGQHNTVIYGGPLELIQDDHRFNHGFIVRRFVISFARPWDSAAGSRDCYAVLGTHPNAIIDAGGTVATWNWDDRRQVAWCSTNALGDSYQEAVFELIDPTHVIVRNLYLAVTAGVAVGTDFFNYYIELEEVELSDNEAVLAIVQEEAQDVN